MNSDSSSSENTDSDDSIPVSPGITPMMQKIILRSLPPEQRSNIDHVIESLADSDSESSSESDSDSELEIMYSKFKKKQLPKLRTDKPVKISYLALRDEERGGCTICMSALTRSDSLIRLRCRDVMHSSCYEEWKTRSYRCPKCLKTIDDYRANLEFDRLDQAIEELDDDWTTNPLCKVRCIDCETEVEEPKNPIKNRCGVCGSYNTTCNL